jgi:hypothetical protein
VERIPGRDLAGYHLLVAARRHAAAAADVHPALPPRNAYILLHHAIYFNGHGTTQALTVLLKYIGVAPVILAVLDWRSAEPMVPADAAEAAAMAVPIGASP